MPARSKMIVLGPVLAQLQNIPKQVLHIIKTDTKRYLNLFDKVICNPQNRYAGVAQMSRHQRRRTNSENSFDRTLAMTPIGRFKVKQFVQMQHATAKRLTGNLCPPPIFQAH